MALTLKRRLGVCMIQEAEAKLAKLEAGWQEKLQGAVCQREERETELRQEGRKIVREQREHLQQEKQQELNAQEARYLQPSESCNSCNSCIISCTI